MSMQLRSVFLWKKWWSIDLREVKLIYFFSSKMRIFLVGKNIQLWIVIWKPSEYGRGWSFRERARAALCLPGGSWGITSNVLAASKNNKRDCLFFLFLKKSPWLEMVTLQNADADEVLQECTISGGVDGEGWYEGATSWPEIEDALLQVWELQQGGSWLGVALWVLSHLGKL